MCIFVWCSAVRLKNWTFTVNTRWWSINTKQNSPAHHASHHSSCLNPTIYIYLYINILVRRVLSYTTVGFIARRCDDCRRQIQGYQWREMKINNVIFYVKISIRKSAINSVFFYPFFKSFPYLRYSRLDLSFKYMRQQKLTTVSV